MENKLYKVLVEKARSRFIYYVVATNYKTVEEILDNEMNISGDNNKEIEEIELVSYNVFINQ